MAGELAQAPDVSEDVNVALEALRLVDMLDDPDKREEEITGDYQALRLHQSHSGELYPQVTLDEGIPTLQSMFGVLCESTSEAFYGLRIVGKNGDVGQHTDLELNGMGTRPTHTKNWGIHGRLAVHGQKPEIAAIEKLLHFTDRSSSLSLGLEQQRKLAALRSLQAEYEGANPEYNLGLVNIAAFIMIALQRQIKGEAMPLSWEGVSIPQLTIPTREDGTHILIYMEEKGPLLLPLNGARETVPTEELRGIGISVGTNVSLIRPEA